MAHVLRAVDARENVAEKTFVASKADLEKQCPGDSKTEALVATDGNADATSMKVQQKDQFSFCETGLKF